MINARFFFVEIKDKQKNNTQTKNHKMFVRHAMHSDLMIVTVRHFGYFARSGGSNDIRFRGVCVCDDDDKLTVEPGPKNPFVFVRPKVSPRKTAKQKKNETKKSEKRKTICTFN